MKGQPINFKLCVDGGMRKKPEAAAGLAVFIAKQGPLGSWEYHTIKRKGEYLTGVMSAFHAEALAIALERALQTLKEMMESVLIRVS